MANASAPIVFSSSAPNNFKSNSGLGSDSCHSKSEKACSALPEPLAEGGFVTPSLFAIYELCDVSFPSRVRGNFATASATAPSPTPSCPATVRMYCSLAIGLCTSAMNGKTTASTFRRNLSCCGACSRSTSSRKSMMSFALRIASRHASAPLLSIKSAGSNPVGSWATFTLMPEAIAVRAVLPAAFIPASSASSAITKLSVIRRIRAACSVVKAVPDTATVFPHPA